MANTPMMQQYMDAKAACGDALLLFRMGDFYELFYEDAKVAAQEIGLTLTSRDKGENPIPMAGFPHHQLESYLGKLIRKGFRAAVCEQVEDPRKAKGLVKREVTRLVSPGTITDDGLLDPQSNNYLSALLWEEGDAPQAAGVAWADLSTGRFYASTFPASRVGDQLARIAPAECLLNEDQATDRYPGDPPVLTSRASWSFGLDSARNALMKHFEVKTLEGFGFTAGDTLAVRAAGALLDYLQESQRASLEHLDRPAPFRAETTLEIDHATRRSLEITRTMRDGQRSGALLGVMDRTVSALGARLLAEWLDSPLTTLAEIEARLDAVEEFKGYASLRRELRETLRGVYDLERLLARVSTGRASPRDLKFIGRTLLRLPAVKTELSERRSELLLSLEQQLDLCPEIATQLENALADDCPLQAKDGGFIRSGYSAELDDLRKLAAGGKQWIADYQARESQRTGISNLKVGFNKVFGYYIELTNAHRDSAPQEYIRKQTLKNAERYITPELKEYEEKVLDADEKSKDLEYELFSQLRETVRGAARRLQQTAAVLAQLDVLLGFADLAASRDYCRPALCDEPVLEIRDGRHPVLDILQPEGVFVPNDTAATPDDGMILLITGPNMAGKSTYIRQVALINLLAQVGSFVPAREARIGIADRIFARVGASDELSKGQSTFMVEMTETARILNTATGRSLVILDEIGRGTSTYDGVSLAWAIVEHIHDQIGCRTLFATHYHELTDLQSSLSSVRNLNVAVKEWDDNVVFLHKIVEGSADKSYGIHVARLAGVPAAVNERAKQILMQLEGEHLDADNRPKIARRRERPRGDVQLTLFAPYDHPVVERLKALDINQLTPLAALELLQQLQVEAERDPAGKPR